MINEIHCGDNKDLIKEVPSETVDLICTDPPYGLKMADWDKDLPDRSIWTESFRVLKPGAFLLVMSSPRQDLLWRLIKDIELAGFKIDMPSFYWVYAQGAGKGGNIHKSFNKRRAKEDLAESDEFLGSFTPNSFKPAVEVIIFAMKPLSEKTYLDQAIKNQKGIVWRDRGRIPTGSEIKPYREPSHLIVSDDALNDGEIRTSGKMSPENKRGKTNKDGYQGSTYGKFNLKDKPLNQTVGDSGSFSRFFSLDLWWDAMPEGIKNVLPFLPVKKPGGKEKEAGLEVKKVKNKRGVGVAWDKESDSGIFKDREKKSNSHVSVKPIKLMTYLIGMTTEEGDIVLDPYTGTGTTLIAAQMLNRKFIGFEKEEEYVEMSKKRLEYFKKEK